MPCYDLNFSLICRFPKRITTALAWFNAVPIHCSEAVWTACTAFHSQAKKDLSEDHVVNTRGDDEASNKHFAAPILSDNSFFANKCEAGRIFYTYTAKDIWMWTSWLVGIVHLLKFSSSKCWIKIDMYLRLNIYMQLCTLGKKSVAFFHVSRSGISLLMMSKLF